MNTLTKFIEKNLQLHAHSNLEALPEGNLNNPSSESTKYEVIENELLKNSDLKGLSISGSLFSLTTFKNVTFEDCVFFGSKIENCEFINCKFSNCSFQFTNIAHSNFRACKFKDVQWDVSPVRKSVFSYCALDSKTSYFISKEDNVQAQCYASQPVTWAQVLDQTPAEVEEEQPVELGYIMSHFKKLAA